MLLATAATAAACAGPGGVRFQQATPEGAKEDFRDLPIPELYEGELDGTTRRFELTAQSGQAEILPGTMTHTWGFNGAWLGPTLYMRRGEHIEMAVHNNVREPTVVHWHGLHLPAAADGGPALIFDPGQAWEPTWDVDQPAATCWYHPHPHNKSGLHAYRGLAGGLIVADDESDALDLPHDYGVDDIPVIITDAKFGAGGQLDESFDPDYGLLGDTPLINGITKPQFTATTRRVRLRLVNGATMRFHHLVVGKPFQVIATDQGLLDAPVEADGILLSPGERAEILVDLEPGKDLMLRSDGVPDGGGLPKEDAANGFGLRDTFNLLKITGPDESAPEVGEVPGMLVGVDKPDVSGAPERELALSGFEINGQTMDMNRVDLVIDHDGPEIWRVTNENTDWPHNFHIHNARFMVESVERGDVAFTRGWHDTIYIPPGATATLLVEFGHYPDPSLAYMYHCHMLYHEDQGMMGQYVIVEPGQQPALGAHAGH
ncbi:multicopper oxidase domain-containing protein [Corynebacterium sp. P3-F1]|uniref:multicopper oxidase family protein n=1 Tax=Corynebacterium sp. P3-F1 TaxID=3059080 RepID=UPI00265D0287|nr:multicopper oxidase domain-containing protein [Corynebacterium sp. P3-F1]WKK61192.1 multicopper oxidase domain-containing protein [Corynebacterium sp. P3-F1]